MSLSAKERSQSHPCHCRGTGWLRGAYLEAPEPPDVLAPLKAGRLQPLIQAAFQGAQARGTSTDDSYSPGSHVPRCGGGRDAGEAVARSKKALKGGCRARQIPPGRLPGAAWLGGDYLCDSCGRLRPAGVSQDVFLSDMIYRFPPLPCHASCLHLPSARCTLSSVNS